MGQKNQRTITNGCSEQIGVSQIGVTQIGVTQPRLNNSSLFVIIFNTAATMSSTIMIVLFAAVAAVCTGMMGGLVGMGWDRGVGWDGVRVRVVLDSERQAVRRLVIMCSLHKKATFSKLRVAYNNVYRKVFGLKRRSSASEMFVLNNIYNFEALMRKSIFAFTTRLSNSKNALICTIQRSLFGKSGQTSCSSRSRLFQFTYFTILQTIIFFCIVC